MRTKVLILFVIVLVGAIAALGFAWPFGSRHKELKLPGTVEVHEVRLGARVAGRVKEVLVKESDSVEPGQELVRLDVPDLTAQRSVWQAKVREAEAELLKAKNGPRQQEKDAARAAADAARARYDRLKAGYREEEKRQAASDFAAAQVDEKHAQLEYDREARLQNGAAGKRADMDAARSNLNRTKSRTLAAKAKLDLINAGSRHEDIDEAKAEMARLEANVRLLEAGTRYEEIAAAEARVAEIKARLAELEVSIAEAVIKAQESAIVELVSVRPGDLVQAHQPIVRVLRGGDLWVKTYVPETELGKLRLGQEVSVTMDSFPGRRFVGKVVHIGNESEFTPRNVQSVDERRHQLFSVRVRVEDTKGYFKSGMAAEVYIPVP